MDVYIMQLKSLIFSKKKKKICNTLAIIYSECKDMHATTDHSCMYFSINTIMMVQVYILYSTVKKTIKKKMHCLSYSCAQSLDEQVVHNLREGYILEEIVKFKNHIR